MRLSPVAAGSVEVTGAPIAGLLLIGPVGSVAATTPGAGSEPAGSDTPSGRRAGTEIGQRICGDYQDITNWQNLRVFKISPVSGDRCVTTTGNDQNVSYRFEGTGDLRGEEPICLYRVAELSELLRRAGDEVACRLREG